MTLVLIVNGRSWDLAVRPEGYVPAPVAAPPKPPEPRKKIIPPGKFLERTSIYTIRAIAAAVSETLDEPLSLLLADCRGYRAVAVRQIVMGIAWDVYGATQPRIGLALGRDSSTAWHGIECCKTRLKTDQAFRADYIKALAEINRRAKAWEEDYESEPSSGQRRGRRRGYEGDRTHSRSRLHQRAL